MVQVSIRMLEIFEWFKFPFESHSSGSNLHSNVSNLVQMVRICIGMLQIPLEWFVFAFECFESRSNSWNLHSNALNPV